MEQMTLEQVEAFAKDAEDCMAAASMFPPMLDAESKERVQHSFSTALTRKGSDQQISRHRKGVSRPHLHRVQKGV